MSRIIKTTEIMKNIYLFIILFISASTCKAQVNQLTNLEVDNIEFNTVSLRELLDSGASTDEIKSLLGDDLEASINTSAPFLTKDFSNEHLYLSFEDSTDSGNGYNLNYIRIKTSSIAVKVKDRVVKIGDSVTKFGNGVIINTKNGDYSVVFVSPLSSSIGFKINPLTNRISEIRFEVFY